MEISQRPSIWVPAGSSHRFQGHHSSRLFCGSAPLFFGHISRNNFWNRFRRICAMHHNWWWCQVIHFVKLDHPFCIQLFRSLLWKKDQTAKGELGPAGVIRYAWQGRILNKNFLTHVSKRITHHLGFEKAIRFNNIPHHHNTPFNFLSILVWGVAILCQQCLIPFTTELCHSLCFSLPQCCTNCRSRTDEGWSNQGEEDIKARAGHDEVKDQSQGKNYRVLRCGAPPWS